MDTAETASAAVQVADAGGAAGVIAAPVSTAGFANAEAAPEPARVPTVAVRSAQASSEKWALEPGEIERLVKRGEDYLAQGDIAAARLILGRAAETRDARAAFSLAASYDPTVLRQLHVVGFRPDVAQARAWYEKAVEYGSAEASRRLAALPTLSR
jgi:TPR repeat protein